MLFSLLVSEFIDATQTFFLSAQRFNISIFISVGNDSRDFAEPASLRPLQAPDCARSSSDSLGAEYPRPAASRADGKM